MGGAEERLNPGDGTPSGEGDALSGEADSADGCIAGRITLNAVRFSQVQRVGREAGAAAHMAAEIAAGGAGKIVPISSRPVAVLKRGGEAGLKLIRSKDPRESGSDGGVDTVAET